MLTNLSKLAVCIFSFFYFIFSFLGLSLHAHGFTTLSDHTVKQNNYFILGEWALPNVDRIGWSIALQIREPLDRDVFLGWIFCKKFMK